MKQPRQTSRDSRQAGVEMWLSGCLVEVEGCLTQQFVEVEAAEQFWTEA